MHSKPFSGKCIFSCKFFQIFLNYNQEILAATTKQSNKKEKKIHAIPDQYTQYYD